MNAAPLARILIVDDEAAQMRALRDTLRDQGYETAGFTTGDDALRALQEKPFDLLLTDLMMPGMDGVTLLASALKIDPQLVGILMTGKGTIETAVQAMQAGALDYILKPFKLSAILPVISRAVSVRRLRLENLELRDTVAIHELNQAIAHTLDPNVLLDKIADAALAQFEADEVSIMLLADDGRALHIAAVRGERRDTLLGTRVPIGEGIAGWVAARCELVVLEGEVKHPLPAPLHPRAEIQSALSMPMITRNHLIGVLNVNCIRKRQAFTLGQIKVLSIFTNAAAAGIEAARLHEAQRKADARYREVLHMAADGIISIDEEQRIVVFNGGAEKLFGYCAEEVLGKPLEMLLPAAAAEAHRRHVRVFGQGPDQSRAMAGRDRLFGRRKDGTLVNIEVGISKRSESSGTLLTAVVRDITERVRTEAERKRLLDVLEASLNEIYIFAPDTLRFWYVNPSALRNLGHSADAVRAMTPLDLKPEFDRDSFGRLIGPLLRGEQNAMTFRTTHRRADGSLYPVEVHLQLVGEGDQRLFLAVIYDITERLEAEQALRHQARQLRLLSRRLFEAEESARRQLARELHDRIGHNVTSLSLNLHAMRGELPEDRRERVTLRLDDCDTLLSDTARMVRDVMTDLRPPGIDELGLVAALSEHARQVSARAGLPIAVSGAEAQPRLAPASEITLFRIAQEALVNVLKHAGATEVTIGFEAGPDHVVLTVADNGAGFDPAAVGDARLHLGLVGMRERAESIGGVLRVESAPGPGTRVIVQAPLAAEATPA